MKHIVISVSNDLVTDQRVHRVCSTLTDMQYNVFLIGRKLPNSLPIDKTYKTQRIKLLFSSGFLFYAEYNIRLFFKLLFTKKDILYANDLDTLLPNYLMSKIFNKKLIFDSHELFPEIPELIHRPKVKSIWKFLEKSIIPELKNTITVSKSIADYYLKHYNTKFEIIRNVPFKNDLTNINEFPFSHYNKKIIIYQGALNIGRGIELMIEAMQYIDNAFFIIIGQGDISKQLKQKTFDLNLADKIIFLGKITPEELKTLTSSADVGISLEEDLGLNYRFALPNKLFDYIQAEIPVIVSDLPEMSKVVENYDIGIVLKHRMPEALAKSIIKILSEGKAKWNNQLKKASKEFVWDVECEKLKKFIYNLK